MNITRYSTLLMLAIILAGCDMFGVGEEDMVFANEAELAALSKQVSAGETQEMVQSKLGTAVLSEVDHTGKGCEIFSSGRSASGALLLTKVFYENSRVTRALGEQDFGLVDCAVSG